MENEVQSEQLFAQPPRLRPENFRYVRHHVDGPVARLTLNRPEHNLLDASMLRELADGLGVVSENAFQAAWTSANIPPSARSPCSTLFTRRASPWSRRPSRCW